MSGAPNAHGIGPNKGPQAPSLYLALPVEQALARDLCKQARALLADAKGACSFRLAPAEGLHLTLAFFGDLPAAQIDRLRPALDAAFGNQPELLQPLELELGPAGSFPETGAARVLWLDARPQRPAALQGLARLAWVAARSVEIADLNGEQAFTAHVTLARRGRGRGPGPQAFLRHAWRGAWIPSRVSLLEARTDADGRRPSRERWARDFESKA